MVIHNCANVALSVQKLSMAVAALRQTTETETNHVVVVDVLLDIAPLLGTIAWFLRYLLLLLLGGWQNSFSDHLHDRVLVARFV